MKIGVLFVAPNQTSQRDILANTQDSMSLGFKGFLSGLGTMVDLRTHKGFAGKLDLKYFSNGKKMLYHVSDKVETAFHVATLMPTASSDPQQVAKKRHLGNDHVTIVWNEHKRDYLPITVTSEFNDVVIVLSPLERKGLIRVKITSKEGIGRCVRCSVSRINDLLL